MANEAKDAATVKPSAEEEAAKVSAPAPAPMPADAPAKRENPGPERLGRLGPKLLLWLLALTALLTAAAALRQYVVQLPKPPRLVFVPRHDLPAYYRIRTEDLRPRLDFTGNAEAETPKKASDIVGRYTFQSLRKGEPIAEANLGPAIDGALFSGKTAIEVSLTEATLLNGMPNAGDFIDVAFGPPAAQGQQSQTSPGASFQNVLVLNGRPTETTNSAAPVPSEKNHVLVLALPPERQAEFEAELAKKTPLIIRKKDLTR